MFTATYRGSELTVEFTCEGIRGDAPGQHPFYEPDPGTTEIVFIEFLGRTYEGRRIKEAWPADLVDSIMDLADEVDFERSG